MLLTACLRHVVSAIALSVLGAAGTLTAAAELIHDSAFDQAAVVVDHHREGKRTGSFVGVLPPGWVEDFSGWSTSEGTSQIVSEGQRRYLKLSVTSGFGQFNAPLPALTEGAFYRLSLQARNLGVGPLLVGLRMRPAPYQFVWATMVQSSDRWVDQSWCFKLDKKPSQELGIFLNPQGLGEVDVSHLRIEQVSDQEMAAQIQRPSPMVRNLLRNSRFPAGIPSGWNLGRECDSAMAATDAAKIGPSGSPALRLMTLPTATDTPCTLYSEPFSVAEPTQPHRAALSFTGSGRWRVSVLQQGREIATKELAPTGDWSRDSLAFQPSLTARCFSLKITGTGTLWIDSLAAYAGAADRPYESAGACEVALAPTASEIAETRIQFEDEPATVAYVVSGAHRGGVLKATVSDVHGQTKPLPDVALAGSDNAVSGTLNAAVFPEAPFGQFRIESWVERDGQKLSPINELVITRLRRPIFWGKDAPDSPFGGHALAVDRTLRILKSGGINWARLHDAGTEYTGWYWLEPQPGVWKFRDDAIAHYRSNHLKLYAQLGSAPKWASYLSTSTATGYFSVWFQPLTLDPYANYVKTLVTHYRGVIDEYFVWNEPWNIGWWAVAYDKNHVANDGYITSEHPQADFAKMAKVAYDTAKAVDPAIKISSFPINAGAWGKGLIDAGGAANTDIIDYHCYLSQPTGFPGDAAEVDYAKTTSYLTQQTGAISKPVYMGEGQGGGEGHESGEASTDYTGIYHYSVPFTSADDSIRMANQTVTFELSLLAQKVSRFFIYSSHCYQSLGTSAFNNALLCNDGYPHPSLAAHSNFAWHVEGKKHQKTITVAAGVTAYLFQGDRGAVAVLSPRAGHAVYTVPTSATITVRDLFGNPLPANAPVTDTVVFVSTTQSAAQLEALLSAPAAK